MIQFGTVTVAFKTPADYQAYVAQHQAALQAKVSREGGELAKIIVQNEPEKQTITLDVKPNLLLKTRVALEQQWMEMLVTLLQQTNTAATFTHTFETKPSSN